MKFSIECDQEDDGRWLAEVPQIPGALCYGTTQDEAMAKVETLALRIIADRTAALGKAVGRAAERLDISMAALAKILGVSPSTISRLYSGEYLLDQNRKEWETALLFVRAFRSLDSIIGNEETARKWLNSHNLGLNGRPIDLMKHTEGLVRVVQYLEASHCP